MVFKCIFLHVKSLSISKIENNVWPPQGHQKACSNKGFSLLHIFVLIAIKTLSEDVIFTGLKHFYVLPIFSPLVKLFGF